MFVLNDLRRFADFSDKGIYAYKTNDTKNAVETAGYFDNAVAAGHLEQGALLIVAGDLDGTPWHSSYTISANDGTHATLVEAAHVTQSPLYEIFMPKISNKAADAEVFRYVPNFAGSITTMRSVLNAALATGDATLTLKINGTNVTNGVITVTQSGSAAGDVDIATPTAANTFAAGDVISVTAGGSSTATSTNNISLKLTPS